MSVNNKEIPILVIYYTKSRIIYQGEFGSFSNFGSLIDFFNSKIASDSFKLKKKYILNDKEVKNDDQLINLIQDFALSTNIISATFSIEIDELFNIGDEEIHPYRKILQPKLDNFGIYIFKPESGSLSLEEYPEKIINHFQLQKINISSSYCNSYDSLYIAGGIYNNEEIKDFWIINNQNFRILKKEMPFVKSNHSMIYIEYNNKKFIFFSGGNNLLSFYYDIREKKFESWGDMNSLYNRPSLIQIEKYIYCFNFSLDKENKLFFEKTNLDGNAHIWEKVYPNFENEEEKEKVMNKKFCVSKCAGRKIILIGNNYKEVNEDNILLYDIDMNMIYVNKICSEQYINSIDKSFYKINKSHSIALPDFSGKNELFEIGVLNKIKYTFRKIKLNPCEQNQINLRKFKNIRDENTDIGKIFFEFKTEELNQDSENNINEINKNVNNLEQFIFNVDSNKINSEKNIPTMIDSKFLNNQKEENELENNQINPKNNQDHNKLENNEEEKDENEDYIIYNNNNEVDNIDKKFNEDNEEIENFLEDKINNEDNKENNEDNFIDNELYEEVENAEEEEIERDKFELTIRQPLGEDIIQIENYPMSNYDPEAFCDYDPE